MDIISAVFRIRDILREIRILGSVHWITDPDLALDPDLSNFFCLLLSVGKFTSVFNDNMSLRSHKTVDMKFFIIFLLVDRLIRILETQELTDPPDPEHCIAALMPPRPK
jgi:hypothetical protein